MKKAEPNQNPSPERDATIRRDVEDNGPEWQRTGGRAPGAPSPEDAGPGAHRQKGPTGKKAPLPHEDEDDVQEWRRAGGSEPGTPHRDAPGTDEPG